MRGRVEEPSEGEGGGTEGGEGWRGRGRRKVEELSEGEGGGAE